MATRKILPAKASFETVTGWKLFIGEENVTGFIPRQKLFSKMETRKCYSDGFRGYSYRDWVRHNKWVKALADSKEQRLCIFNAIRKADF